MCSRSKSYAFPFLDVSIFHSYISNSDVFIINTSFSNFHFAIDTNIFQDENLKLLFTKCKPLESSYIDSDITTLMISIKSIQKKIVSCNSSSNTALLSKHFEDLQFFLHLSKHCFDIIGISEHKYLKARKTPLLIYLAIHAVLIKPKPPMEEQIFLLVIT